MAYSIRSFCRSSDTPTIKELVYWAKQSWRQIHVEEMPEQMWYTHDWDSYSFTYANDKTPIEVTLHQVKEQDGLAKKKIDKELHKLGAPGLSFRKRRVIRHLKGSRFIVTFRIPSTDIDDDGYFAIEEMLNYLVKNYRGLTHTDDEGFYKGKKVFVRTSG